jgi:hypothetical protein
MSIRFRRRLSIFPGFRLNLSRSGVSVSLGGRGAWYTIGRHGTRATVGLPGSGLSYSSYRRYPHHVVRPRPLSSMIWGYVAIAALVWWLIH